MVFTEIGFNAIRIISISTRRHSHRHRHTDIHKVMCAYSLANRTVGNSATSQFRPNFLNNSTKRISHAVYVNVYTIAIGIRNVATNVGSVGVFIS